MPGYPKVALTNPYLIARYDGSVIDAMPWGHGVIGGAGTGAGAGQPQGMGVWPGAPLSGGGKAPGGSGASGKAGWFDEAGAVYKLNALGTIACLKTPGFVNHGAYQVISWFHKVCFFEFNLYRYDEVLNPTLSKDVIAAAAKEALEVERRNPMALAHFANHPPKGIAPNVVVAAVDVVFPALPPMDADDADAFAREQDLRRFLPNVGLGKWGKPQTPQQLAEGKQKKEAKGWMGKLEEWFGDEDEGPAPGAGKRAAREAWLGQWGKKGEKKAEGEGESMREEVVVPTLVLVAVAGGCTRLIQLSHKRESAWFSAIEPIK
jgi:hypothetical protein